MTQWFMAAQKPPHLACIAPYDGLIDAYTGIAYSGASQQISEYLVQRRVAGRETSILCRPSKMLPWDFGDEAKKTFSDATTRPPGRSERLRAAQSKIEPPGAPIGLVEVDLHSGTG